MLPYSANAQWKIGVTGGATLNHYTVDKQYMEDWQCSNLWGGTAGITAQYDFLSIKKWKLCVRADLNWTQKNHDEYRTNIPIINEFAFRFINNYIQLPLMMSFCFGDKLKGFANVGLYSGYWFSSYNIYPPTYSLLDYLNLNISRMYSDTYKRKNDFDSKRDKRLDIGFVGGVGVEWQFSSRCGVEIEARYYRSSNTRKDYMIIKSPHYNDTFVFQAGLLCYL